ncbi:DUF4352 domain-containing protein [Thermus sp. SYSU G05001]|uniref:DUF4352 domain-containing protein n=1 Tax=Thermus brevis TaxID=2862456 RepID=A0ABS7A1T4_9DEIN|nr:DUF4352 domain-containing protein [Thermus brevis]MBW6395270.1 DUF4352 domain-containing protein [Thermus brevis]
MGGLLVLAGLGLIIFGLTRKRGQKWKGVLGGVLVLVVGAALSPSPEQGTQPAPAAQIGESPAQAPASQPSKASSTAEPGTTLRVGIWDITAGHAEIKRLKVLGNEYVNTRADDGFVYALVPVSVTNVSNKTDSLLFVTWVLQDSQGREYEVETLSDMYLPEGARLDLVDVPPGATRSGYLVYQVAENASGLVLIVRAGLSGEKSWQLE